MSLLPNAMGEDHAKRKKVTVDVDAEVLDKISMLAWKSEWTQAQMIRWILKRREMKQWDEFYRRDSHNAS